MCITLCQPRHNEFNSCLHRNLSSHQQSLVLLEPVLDATCRAMLGSVTQACHQYHVTREVLHENFCALPVYVRDTLGRVVPCRQEEKLEGCCQHV